jgi:hypothetical protein
VHPDAGAPARAIWWTVQLLLARSQSAEGGDMKWVALVVIFVVPLIVNWWPVIELARGEK